MTGLFQGGCVLHTFGDNISEFKVKYSQMHGDFLLDELQNQNWYEQNHLNEKNFEYDKCYYYVVMLGIFLRSCMHLKQL